MSIDSNTVQMTIGTATRITGTTPMIAKSMGGLLAVGAIDLESYTQGVGAAAYEVMKLSKDITDIEADRLWHNSFDRHGKGECKGWLMLTLRFQTHKAATAFRKRYAKEIADGMKSQHIDPALAGEAIADA